MIYHLRKKFIRICMCSFFAVFFVIFGTIFAVTSIQTTRMMDALAALIAENDGRFPGYDSLLARPQGPPNGVGRESPFTTRFFTAHFNTEGTLTNLDIRNTASVSQSTARELATDAFSKGSERGWADGFRYLLVKDDAGTLAVFVNASDEWSASLRFFGTACAIFVGASLLVMLLVTLLSKRAVRPVAESLEKQQQFITDAGHELKTPLTLIRTNLDIIEAEQGSSPWLEDIRTEACSMTQLVNHLVTLTRMDEMNSGWADKETISLSALCAETAEAFAPLAEQNGLTFTASFAPDVTLACDQRAIRELLSILLDNACKYCDAGGNINLTLTGGAHPTLQLKNSYAAVQTLATDRLFDRFYRADPARTQGSGFGLGLSIAKAICERHHAQISASAEGSQTIVFKVRF